MPTATNTVVGNQYANADQHTGRSNAYTDQYARRADQHTPRADSNLDTDDGIVVGFSSDRGIG